MQAGSRRENRHQETESGARCDRRPAWPFRGRPPGHCSSLVSWSRYRSAAADGTPLGGAGTAYAAGALKPFSTCDTVLQYFKDQAPEYLIDRAGGGGHCYH